MVTRKTQRKTPYARSVMASIRSLALGFLAASFSQLACSQRRAAAYALMSSRVSSWMYIFSERSPPKFSSKTFHGRLDKHNLKEEGFSQLLKYLAQLRVVAGILV